MTAKSRRVVITEQARADIIAHRKYIEASNPDRARDIVIDLVRKFHELAAKGVTGSTRSWAPPSFRAFPYKRYCYYFTISDDALTLIRLRAQVQSLDDLEFDDDVSNED